MCADCRDGLGVAEYDHIELPLQRALEDDVGGGSNVHVAVVPGGPLGVQGPAAASSSG